MNNMNNNNILISIEGNIGSGKSTFLNYLKQKYHNNSSVIFMDEPVDEWQNIKDKNGNDILELFYNDKEKYAFSFQMLAFISRYKLLNDVIHQNKSKIIISERSLFTDEYVFAQMLYDSKHIKDVEFQIYKKWVLAFSELIPNQIIYIANDPIVSLNRISVRSRKGENNISEDYLNSCHIYHQNMMNAIKEKYSASCEIITFDGNIDIFKMKDTFDKWDKSLNICQSIHSSSSHENLIHIVNGC